MDAKRFYDIINNENLPEPQLIGTLGEKTIHRLLKKYLEPDSAFHEIKVGSYFADICRDGEIVEIQTKQFNKLRDKLSVFLEDHRVKIVFPSFATKWLLWIDPQTGEVSKKRRSPAAGTAYRIFPELYRIKSFLNHPNLSFSILLLNMEEYRYLNGWSEDRKKGSVCQDRLPLSLVQEIVINSPADYIKLIPLGLDFVFTSKDFASAAKMTLKKAQLAVNVLCFVGAIIKTGKAGKMTLYEKTNSSGKIKDKEV